MLINASCTIYHRSIDPETGYSIWERQYVPQCWWFVDTKAAVTTEGLKSEDMLSVRIPDTTIVIKKDDYIVKGECPVEMNTLKDLVAYEYYKVTKANYNMFGNCKHIRVVGV